MSSSKYYYRRRSTSKERTYTDRTPVYQNEVLKKCSSEDPFTIRERLQKLEQQMFDSNMKLDNITHMSTILDLKYTGFIHKLNTHIKTRKKLLEIIKKGRRKQIKGSVDPASSSSLKPSTSFNQPIPKSTKRTKETERHENVQSSVTDSAVADAKNKFPLSSIQEVLEKSVKETEKDKKHVVDKNAKEQNLDSLIPHIKSINLESSTNLGPENISTKSGQDVREPQELEVTKPAIGEFKIAVSDISNILDNDSVQGLLKLSVEHVTADDPSTDMIETVQDRRQELENKSDNFALKSKDERKKEYQNKEDTTPTKKMGVSKLNAPDESSPKEVLQIALPMVDETSDINVTASTESNNPIDESEQISGSVEQKSDNSIAASTELDLSTEVEENSSEDVLEQVPPKIHEKAANISKDLLEQALHMVYKTSYSATNVIDGTELNVKDEKSSSKEPEKSSSKEVTACSSEEILKQPSSTKEETAANISKELLKQALITVYKTSDSPKTGTESNVFKEVKDSTFKEELKQALTTIDDKSDVCVTSTETDIAKEDEENEQVDVMCGTKSNIPQQSEKAQITIDETADIIDKEVLQQTFTKVDEISDINVTDKTESDILKESDDTLATIDEKDDIIIIEVEKGTILKVDEKADIIVTSTESDSSKEDEESGLEEVKEQVLPTTVKKTSATVRKSKLPTAPVAIPSSSKTGKPAHVVKTKKKISGKRYGFTPEYDYRLDLFEEFLKNEISAQADHNEPTERVTLKMAIWDQNPMDDIKVATLRQALLVEAKEQLRYSNFRPEFDKLESKQNCLNVTCNNELTFDWVKAITKGLDLWEGIQLEIKEQIPPKPLPAILHAKLSDANTVENAITYLKTQNPELNVHEWKMYHSLRKPAESLQLIFFAIPESSLKELEKTKHWVNLGKQKTYVQVFLENREVKLPIKPSKKPRLQGDVLCGFH